MRINSISNSTNSLPITMSESLTIKKSILNKSSGDDLYIVLDGQQRLTSLYIGLKGTRTLKKKGARNDNPNAYEEKRLYLNLKHQPNMDNPGDNYQFEFYAKVPTNDKENLWFKVGDILELESVF